MPRFSVLYTILAITVVAVQGEPQVDTRIRWTYTGSASPPEYAETPVLANEYILILHGTEVTALNATIGLKAWDWKLKSGNAPFCKPALSANKTVMYIGLCSSGGSKLYALNTETGKLIWTSKDSFLLFGSSLVLSPDDKTLMVASQGYGAVQAFDTGTGEMRWKQLSQSRGSPFCSPVMSADSQIVYTATFGMDGGAYAIDMKNGSVIWRTHYNNDGGGVLLSKDEKLLFLDGMAMLTRNGEQIWGRRQYFFSGGHNLLESTGKFAGKFLYAAYADHSVHDSLACFSVKTGNKTWSVDAWGGGAYPVLDRTGSIIYFGTTDDYLFSVSTENGKVNWKTKIAWLEGNVLIAHNGKRLYAASASAGQLYAFNSDTGTVVWNSTIGPAVKVGLIGGASEVVQSRDKSTLFVKTNGSPSRKIPWKVTAVYAL